jgi:hypothetical protein
LFRPAVKTHCFQGFQKFLAGFCSENALFSLSLRRNVERMTRFPRSTAVEQLSAATIDPVWQVNYGFWERAGGILPCKQYKAF